MQLFNSLTKKLERFAPQHTPEVGVYSCGPTVYDYQHIGNYATYVRWDTLIRVLRVSGYDVTWVMNITDVGHLASDADEGEDKLQKGARREGKTAWEVAAFYTKDFFENLQALHISTPTHAPKATDHIAEQIALIQTLETKGYTYIIDDGVYFNTSKFSRYGALAGQDLASLKAGARIELNQQKRNPTDFALWKFSPQNEQRDMEWESPWGKGFPGWHIECSAMSMKYLGETLDIHTGGVDHLQVHHTNEIAQSEAATGKPFACYWLHSNHIMIDGAKIAKSLGNSITLSDLAKAGFEPLDVRMLFLQSHYRTQSNFSLGGLEAAKNRRRALQAFADLRFQLRDGGQLDDTAFIETQRVMLEELQRDLHTPEALAALSDLVAAAETGLIDSASTQPFTEFLTFLDATLGLDLLASADISTAQKALIAEREAARGSKDFARADATRKTLATQGIIVRDTPLGTIWARE